ncbi:hypothetical protein FKP32DRAFT_863829 [Trametes sanguinea]|nr:hypothetical protein FKP32DRAFT_863829 [Trametes sanguinea]
MSKKKKCKPIVVCWQCKKSFKGEDACQNHAQAKSHKWRPDAIPVVASTPTIASVNQEATSSATLFTPACPHSSCLVQFVSSTALSTHRRLRHQDLDSNSEPFQFCTMCKALVVWGSEHFTASSNHPNCPACNKGFEDEARLRWHLLAKHTCETCMIHHESSQALEQHYRTSIIHKTSIAIPPEIQQTPASSTTPETPGVGTSGESLSMAERINVSSCAKLVQVAIEGMRGSPSRDFSTEIRASAAGVDETSEDESVLCQRFYQAAIEHFGVESAQQLDQFLSNSAMQQPTSGHGSSRPILPLTTCAPLERDVGLPSLNGVEDASLPMKTVRSAEDAQVECPAEPGTSQRANTDQRIEAGCPGPTAVRPQTGRPTPPRSDTVISWCCRSCKREPMETPVATICGHVFCQSCLLRELEQSGCCPICRKLFLVRLDVGSAQSPS